MKTTLLVLLAGLCLVAATTNLDLPSPDDDFDLEYVPTDVGKDDNVEAFAISPWFGLFFVIQKTVTTLKGVKCTSKEVNAIKDAAQTYVNSIDACGGEAVKKVQQLVNTCNNIIATSNDIIDVRTNICGNASDSTTTKTSFKCFWNMLIKTMKLKYQIRWALYRIWKIPSIPGETGNCVKTAVNDLSSVFTQFPSNVRTCSKLLK